MDPHHQTENLHENDLAEFIRNFGQFWEKHGNTILIVAMALVLGFAGYRFFNYRWTEQHETAWFDLAYETSPAGYREVAQAHDNPTVQALAYLRGGDLLLAKALAPADAEAQPDPLPGDEGAAVEPAPEAPPEPVTQDPARLLEDAADMYQRAMDIAPQPLYRLNAILGLASVAESRRQWDQAEELYGDVIEVAGDYPALAAQARKRLELLPDLKTPVAFAPAPIVEPEAGGVSAGDQSAAPESRSDSAEEAPAAPAE